MRGLPPQGMNLHHEEIEKWANKTSCKDCLKVHFIYVNFPEKFEPYLLRQVIILHGTCEVVTGIVTYHIASYYLTSLF